jgi:hypothetical protein
MDMSVRIGETLIYSVQASQPDRIDPLSAKDAEQLELPNHQF